jgi:outer membrane protein assembly factor BamE (lipoprotein component of BamABCDE complex)
MNSDLGVELYGVIMAGFPGMPPRTVAEDKLLAVKAGMHREEVLSLLGPPLSVSSIQGLDTPRESWTYQIPFGKQLTVRLDGGVVTAPPR